MNVRTDGKETNSSRIIHGRGIVGCFFLSSCFFRHGTTILPGSRVRRIYRGLPRFVRQAFTAALVLRFHRFPTVSLLRFTPLRIFDLPPSFLLNNCSSSNSTSFVFSSNLFLFIRFHLFAPFLCPFRSTKSHDFPRLRSSNREHIEADSG